MELSDIYVVLTCESLSQGELLDCVKEKDSSIIMMTLKEFKDDTNTQYPCVFNADTDYIYICDKDGNALL